MDGLTLSVSDGLDWVVSNTGAYVVAAVATAIGLLVAGEHGAVAGALVGYFGVKSVQSLTWSL